MKKIIGILFSATMCFAMENIEQDVEKNSDSVKIINGVLVLHPYEDIMYSPYVQKELKTSDPLVSVKAFLDDGSSKKPIYLPGNWSEFPESLPLSKLRGKKDGEKLIFTVDTKKKIILTCNQKIHNENDTFENRLSTL